MLATSPANVRRRDDYVPGVLMLYDLPELAGDLAAPVMVVNPLGGNAKPLDNGTINGIYARAAHITVQTGLAEEAVRATLLEFVKVTTAQQPAS